MPTNNLTIIYLLKKYGKLILLSSSAFMENECPPTVKNNIILQKSMYVLVVIIKIKLLVEKKIIKLLIR